MKTPSPSPVDAHPLSTMFQPRSIALVGASEKSIWSHFIIRNFKDFGYEGEVYAVNRGGATVYGVTGYTSCVAIGCPVDVAFIFVPQSAVMEALDDAAAAGIRNAVVLSSGYAEVGGEGVVLQDALLARARDLGVRIWGPNTLGFNNVSARTPVSAIGAVQPILPPSIAIVSQSGATASELNEFAHSQNIGVSFVAATGNQGDITLSNVVDYLVDHAATRAIAIFAETICDPEAFVAAAERARAQAKPIVMLKIGRSVLAAAVAAAHTGSLIGDDTVFNAICERLGVVRVFSPEELVNVAGLLAATGPLPAPGLSFVSISGGACTLVADAAESFGVDLPPNDPETLARLADVLPDFASNLNPLDVTGAAVRDPDLFERILPVMAGARDVGLAAVHMTLPTMPGQGLPAALAAIGRAVTRIDKPVVLVQTCTKALNELSREAIAQHGLPHVVTSIEALLRAVGRAAWWSRQLQRPARPLLLSQTPVPVSDRLSSERAVLDYLAGAGVPVIPARIATSRAEAEAFAATADGPLVLKILSEDIAHKTEVGGVRLDVAPAAVGDAYDAIVASVAAARPDARITGVIVSPMRRGGVELLVGVTRDPTWGPTITIGLGGVLVEVMADVAVAPLPVARDEVLEMLDGLRGARLLKGFRGAPAADFDALADAIVAIGDAALALGPSLASLEINPLLVEGGRIEALDGLVTWMDRETPHGGH